MNDVVYDGTRFLNHLVSTYFGYDPVCGWQSITITRDLKEDGSAVRLSAMTKRKRERKNFCFTNSFTSIVGSVISLKYSIKHFQTN